MATLQLRRARRHARRVLPVAALLCAAVAAIAVARTQSATLTGGIYLVGGPASPSGGSACHGTQCPGGGQVIVRHFRGSVVTSATLDPGQHFHIHLTPGRYTLSGGPTCTAQHIVVNSGTATHADISCSIR